MKTSTKAGYSFRRESNLVLRPNVSHQQMVRLRRRHREIDSLLEKQSGELTISKPQKSKATVKGTSISELPTAATALNERRLNPHSHATRYTHGLS